MVPPLLNSIIIIAAQTLENPSPAVRLESKTTHKEMIINTRDRTKIEYHQPAMSWRADPLHKVFASELVNNDNIEPIFDLSREYVFIISQWCLRLRSQSHAHLRSLYVNLTTVLFLVMEYVLKATLLGVLQ